MKTIRISVPFSSSYNKDFLHSLFIGSQISCSCDNAIFISKFQGNLVAHSPFYTSSVLSMDIIGLYLYSSLFEKSSLSQKFLQLRIILLVLIFAVIEMTVFRGYIFSRIRHRAAKIPKIS